MKYQSKNKVSARICFVHCKVTIPTEVHGDAELRGMAWRLPWKGISGRRGGRGVAGARWLGSGVG